MISIDHLAQYHDQAIWISDDRISAKLAQPGNAIEQIDFHGLQPVSRNAKLLHHPQGVFKFFLDYEANGKKESVALGWDYAQFHPAGILTAHRRGPLRISLDVVVAKHALQAQCHCTAPLTEIDLTVIAFRVIWRTSSQTTAVHGCRTWDRPHVQSKGVLLLKANDRIRLKEWLQRSGDYQGDFLIPEEWRRIIFKRRCVSGMAGWQDVRPEYRDTSMDLYNADTWIQLGCADFALHHPEEDIYEFSSLHFDRQETTLHSPIFTASFAIQPPAGPDRVKAQFARQRRRYQTISESVPHLTLAEYPGIAEFFQRVPQIVESARVTDYGMTRACPGTYYWIWAWDNMVTAMAQCRWGDLTNLRRVIDFIRQHRTDDGAIPGRWTRHLQPMDSRGFGGHDFLFSELVMILYAETQDRNELLANYPVMARAFNELAGRCRENGLFPGIGMYPDLPHKMGRDENYFTAIDSGAWYGFCRNLEKIALLLNDQSLAQQAADLADRVETHFLAVFWDENREFLCDSCNPETMEKIRSYPLFSLLLLESPFGYSLLHNRMQAMSRFLTGQLLCPAGISLTPVWDVNHHTEPAMAAWYPHWDLPAVKTWTFTQDQESLQKWLTIVEHCYQTLGYCPEFLALETPAAEFWQHHGAAWNLNCSTGWYQALIHSLIGIETDIGGITCHPAFALHGRQRAAVKNLCYRGAKWDIETTGCGRFISRLVVDNVPVQGTLKIPVSFYTADHHHISIQYNENSPAGPLLLSLWGAAVIRSETSAEKSVYAIQGLGRVDLRYRGAPTDGVWLDGQRIRPCSETDSADGFCRLTLSGEHELILTV